MPQGVVILMETASFSYGKTPRIPRHIEHVGTALQSRPARAIMGLKTRTGLQTRPHMFYQFFETASRKIHAQIKAC